MTNKYFQLFVDTGGTFTDCIGIDQRGIQYRQKVLSSSSLRSTITKVISQTSCEIADSWKLKRDIFKGFTFRLLGEKEAEVKVISFDMGKKILELEAPFFSSKNLTGRNFELTSYEEAPVLGARLITQTALHENFPDLQLKLGSTKGTNALLENKGAKTLFIVTKGYADLLKIGNQARPDIFALNVEKPRQLTHHIIEVDERIDAKGNILKALNDEGFKKQISSIDKTGIESVAIALMNSYINPRHEEQIATLLSEIGLEFISTSTGLSPLIKILNRAETTVVNAYLSPTIM